MLRWLSDSAGNTSTYRGTKELVSQDQNSQPPAPQCPGCGATLQYIDTENVVRRVSSAGGLDAADADPLLRLSVVQDVLKARDEAAA
jgi:hypothetical protein